MKYSALVMLIIGLTFVGCGPNLSHLPKTVKAEGIVFLDDKPVADATVTFIAKNGNNHCSALTNSEGKFSLDAFKEKKGAVPGDYIVEINQTIASAGEGNAAGLVSVKYGLPKKYASMGTSGLSQTIPDKDITDIQFKLSSK